MFSFYGDGDRRHLHSFPTRRSSDLFDWQMNGDWQFPWSAQLNGNTPADYIAAWRHVHDLFAQAGATNVTRSEEHTSELQSRRDLVCRLLLEKKKEHAVSTEHVGRRR